MRPGLCIRLRNSEPEYHPRPSVSRISRSMAKHQASKAVGTIPAVMGAEGADDLLLMLEKGRRP